VDEQPLGRCRCAVESHVVETPTHFVCRRRLAEDARATELKRLRREWKQQGRSPKEIRDLAAEHKAGNPEPESCGFLLPRTVCKREITRDEAIVYLEKGRTDLLEDFTSRFGRPFSAMLVLREDGRHGFEFPPRRGRAAGGADADAPASETRETRPRAAARRAGKPTRERAAAKTASASRKPRTARKRGAGRKRGAPRDRSGASGDPSRPT
jgi:hypothetical protein